MAAAAAAETFEILGSGNPEYALGRLADAFNAAQKEHVASVPYSTGTAGGIRAIEEKTASLARVGRPLKEEEKARGLIYVSLGRDPVIFAGGADATAKSITSAQIRITSYNVCYTKLLRNAAMELVMGIRLKFLVPLVITVLVLGIGSYLIMQGQLASLTAMNARAQVEAKAQEVGNGIDQAAASALELAASFSQLPDVIEAYRTATQGNIVITSYSIHYTKLYEPRTGVSGSRTARR